MIYVHEEIFCPLLDSLCGADDAESYCRIENGRAVVDDAVAVQV